MSDNLQTKNNYILTLFKFTLCSLCHLNSKQLFNSKRTIVLFYYYELGILNNLI